MLKFTPADHPNQTLSAAFALTQKTENLLGHGQPQGQIRKPAAHPGPESLDLEMDQTAAQVTTYDQAILGLLNVFQFLVEQHVVSFFSSARLWAKAKGFRPRCRQRTTKTAVPASMLASAAPATP